MSKVSVGRTAPAGGLGAPRSVFSVPMFVLLFGISYAFNGLDRQVFPALLGPISKQYALTLSQGGLLSTSFAATIAIFGALSHWFVARLGRKWVLVGGLAFYSIFTALTPLAPDFWTLLCVRTLTGAGEAFQIASLFAIIGAYFGEKRGTYLGFINAFFGVGAFLGPTFGTRLYAETGAWASAFYIYGLLGLVSAASIVFLIPNAFCAARDPEIVHSDPSKVALSRILNRNSIFCLIGFSLLGYSFFSYVALYTSFLQRVLSYSVTAAGQCFGMFGIGALTAFVGGWLGERLGKAGLLSSLGALVVVGYLLFHDVTDPVIQSILSLLFGVLISGYLLPRFVSLIQRSVASDQIGYAMAIGVPVFYASGTFAGLVFGYFVGQVGWGAAAMINVALPPALSFCFCALLNPRRMRGR